MTTMLDVPPGTMIDTATHALASLALLNPREHFGIIFNGVLLIAPSYGHAETNAAMMEAEWHRLFKENSQRYHASDEYRASQEARRVRQEREALVLQGALLAAPEEPLWVDENGWEEQQRINADPYGAAVFRFARTWARLMEGRLRAGVPIADSAEETAALADTEDLTGCQMGCAIALLSLYWAYGAPLRRQIIRLCSSAEWRVGDTPH